jgi:hypothetical protein
MKKRIVLAAILVLSLVPLSLGAQAAENTDFRFLSFDIGYMSGWHLEDRVQQNLALFGLNVRVANSLAVGFQFLNEDGGAYSGSFLLLKYNFLPQLRAAVGFGLETPANTPVSSLGIEVIPFSRSVGNIAVTEFKASVRYDSLFENMKDGRFLFALAVGIGF